MTKELEEVTAQEEEVARGMVEKVVVSGVAA